MLVTVKCFFAAWSSWSGLRLLQARSSRLIDDGRGGPTTYVRYNDVSSMKTQGSWAYDWCVTRRSYICCC